MATTYQQLLEQKRKLEEQQAALLKQLEEAGAAEKAVAVEKVKAIMTEFGLTIGDLQETASKRGRKPGAKSTTAGSKVAAKYKDPVTGNSWTGRGLQPRWLKAALAEGKKIEDFAV